MVLLPGKKPFHNMKKFEPVMGRRVARGGIESDERMADNGIYL